MNEMREKLAEMRVLVVDDEPALCDIWEWRLTKLGFKEVVTALSGHEAIRTLEGRAFDLVITDVRMPGEYDGIDIHDRLIVQQPQANRRMLYMTGNLLDGRTMERLQDLDVRCIEKPFDIHTLAEVINDVCLRATDSPRLTLEAGQAQVVPGSGVSGGRVPGGGDGQAAAG